MLRDRDARVPVRLLVWSLGQTSTGESRCNGSFIQSLRVERWSSAMRELTSVLVRKSTASGVAFGKMLENGRLLRKGSDLQPVHQFMQLTPMSEITAKLLQLNAPYVIS